MTKEALKTLIETTLEIPVFDGADDDGGDSIIYPSATLEASNFPVDIYGDGKPKGRLADAYINLWFETKSERNTAMQLLDAALIGVWGLANNNIEAYYDTTAKKHRAVFSLQFIQFAEPEPDPEPEPEPDTP